MSLPTHCTFYEQFYTGDSTSLSCIFGVSKQIVYPEETI